MRASKDRANIRSHQSTGMKIQHNKLVVEGTTLGGHHYEIEITGARGAAWYAVLTSNKYKRNHQEFE